MMQPNRKNRPTSSFRTRVRSGRGRLYIMRTKSLNAGSAGGQGPPANRLTTKSYSLKWVDCDAKTPIAAEQGWLRGNYGVSLGAATNRENEND